MRRWALVLALGTACADADGDGRSGGADCDDAEARAYVGAVEVCDGVDNDCDGLVDEDVAFVAWQDRDGDGFGDPDRARRVCELPADGVENGDDCDDLDARARPGGDEVCDGVDNDCDDEVDEGVRVTFYEDVDGDGHGVSDSTTEACLVPSGFSRLDDDCDDTEPEAWTGRAELCDGIDNDCDDDVDEDADEVRLWVDLDGDGFGDPNAPTVGCGPVMGAVDNADDCDDTDPDISPDAVEVADNEEDEDCDGYVDEIAVPDHVPDLETARAIAGNGDVVQLGPGLWPGALDLQGETFTLAGAGCGRTTLYGEGDGATVTMDGGGLENVMVSGGTFSGLYVTGGFVTARHVCIRDNVARWIDATEDGYGGGVMVYAGSLTLEDSLVTDNYAEKDGGGLGVHVNATLVANRVRVVGNRARFDGGGVTVRSGVLQMNASVVAGNRCADDGGGIAVRTQNAVEGATGGRVELDHVTFAANTMAGDEPNGASSGADGSGVYVQGNSHAILSNVLFAHAQPWEQPLYDGGADTFTTVWTGFDQAGDREWSAAHEVRGQFGPADFVSFDPDTDPETWDLRLLPGSAFVDAGDPSTQDPDGSRSDIGGYGGPMAGPDANDGVHLDADLDGVIDLWEARYGLPTFRPDGDEDPDADGLDNDMEFSLGCDPTDPDSDGDGVEDGTEVDDGTDPTLKSDRLPMALLSAPAHGAVGEDVVLDASGSGDPDGDPVSWQWTLTVQPPGSTGTLTAVDGVATLAVTSGAGVWAVQVEVTSGNDSAVATQVVTMHDAAIVPDDGTFAEVLAAAQTGDAIAVRAGTHDAAVTSELRDLTIFGLDAPEDVVLLGDGSTAVVDWTDHRSLALHRVTLTGGSDTTGGGLRCQGCDAGDTQDDECAMNPPLPPQIELVDVHVVGNDADELGGGLYLERCDVEAYGLVVDDNEAGQEGGGVYVQLANLTMGDSRIVRNHAPVGGGMSTQVTNEKVAVRGTAFVANTGTLDVGLHWSGSGFADAMGTFEHVVFADHVTATGGIVGWEAGLVRLVDVAFEGNVGKWIIDTKGPTKGKIYALFPAFGTNGATDAVWRNTDLQPRQSVNGDFDWVARTDDPTRDLWWLAAGSDGVDRGHPSFTDRDGSRADVGAGGGRSASPLAQLAQVDADEDGMPDGWEVAFGLDRHSDDAAGDLDQDGRSNLDEYLGGFLPDTTD